MLSVLNTLLYSGHGTIGQINEQIAATMAAMTSVEARQLFFTEMSTDPVNTLNRWLAGQTADLKTIMGHENGHHYRQGSKSVADSSAVELNEAIFHLLSNPAARK